MSPRVALLGVLTAVLLAHLPSLGNGYVQDDHILIESNPVVERGDPAEIFSSAYWEGVHPVPDFALWRPLPILSYAWERQLLARPSPALTHLLNLVLHGGACALLFALAVRHGASVAAATLGALVLGLHPAKSEAVFNGVGRAEILAAGFGLLALLLAAWARTAPAWKARASAWGAAAALFAALASKETAIVFAPLLLLQDLLCSRLAPASERVAAMRRIGALLPSLFALTAFVIVRTLALEAWFAGQTIRPLDNVLAPLGFAERLPHALALMARYVSLVVVPIGLSLDYSGHSLDVGSGWSDPRTWAGAAVLVALTGAVLLGAFGRAQWKGSRALTVLGAATIVGSGLVIGNLLFPVGAIFAERFLYLPMAGFGLLAAAAGWSLGDRATSMRALRGVVMVVLFLWGLGTFARAMQWRDDATAFETALRQVPASPRAAFALAKLRADAIDDPERAPGETEAATRLFDQAIANWNDYPEAWKEKGLLLARAGRLTEAETVLRGALTRGPVNVNARFNHGLVLQRLGRMNEARNAFRHAIVLNPTHAPSWASLGHLARSRGDWHEAFDAYRRAVALGRSDLQPLLDDMRTRLPPEGLPRANPPPIMGGTESP